MILNHPPLGFSCSFNHFNQLTKQQLVIFGGLFYPSRVAHIRFLWRDNLCTILCSTRDSSTTWNVFFSASHFVVCRGLTSSLANSLFYIGVWCDMLWVFLFSCLMSFFCSGSQPISYQVDSSLKFQLFVEILINFSLFCCLFLFCLWFEFFTYNCLWTH